ncbi:MAG: hypothetical protein GY953_01985, partial [bacterium]|nr:hypothetical protein [bacterium]
MKKIVISAIGVSLMAVFMLRAQSAAPVRFVATELLGRPTDSSVTVNVVANSELEAYFEYGRTPGVYAERTQTGTYPGDEPIEVVIDQLSANARYYYHMRYRRPGEAEFQAGEEHTFHTQRPP